MVEAVKTREPILGCTFESGTNVYLWLTMISSFASIIAYLLLHIEDFKKNTASDNTSYLFCYMMIDLWTAITGLYAIEKKRPSLLIPFLVYKALDVLLLAIVLIFFYKSVISSMILTFQTALVHVFAVQDEVIVLEEASMLVIVIFLIIIGFKMYFAFIVYRYYQVMKEKLLGRGRALVKLRPGPVCYVIVK